MKNQYQKQITKPAQTVLMFLLLIILMTGIFSCNKKTYNPEKYEKLLVDEPRSADYEVWINGTKAIVYVARVQDPPWEKEKIKFDFGGNYSFISFDMNKPADVKIKSKTKVFDQTILRPEGISVSNVKKSTAEMSFTIDNPCQIVVMPDGKNGPLMLFANTIDDFKPDLNDPNLIYYGPGIHHPDSSVVVVKDNQTLYLAEGSVLKAGVRVQGDNITICGRGIICGNEFVWGRGARNSILINESNKVSVKGVILRGCASWTLPIRHSQNVVIDNVKIVAGRAQNDDGINPCNSQDVLINNCFIRTDDDCIAVKGMRFLPDKNNNVERVTVENSILWCDRARVFLLGHESRAEYMRDIIFRNLDILNFGWTAYLLEPGENMRMDNIVFEDIRMYGEGQRELIRLKPVVNQYMRTQVPGYISNITFKNVSVTGKEGPYVIQVLGADEEYTVTNVNFINNTILGQKVTNSYKYLEIGNFVSGINFE